MRRLEEFTWKHILDFYSCTDCGRCSDACPAYNTGTQLSPRMISIKCRDEAYETHPVFGKAPAGERPALVGGLIRDEELWACTTCGTGATAEATKCRWQRIAIIWPRSWPG